ncbi:MAG: CHASE2 domain-containing protein [Trueperaceae bacterium]|nr:CHASE2 domain-containing protein [Trueperaceae bacterium]
MRSFSLATVLLALVLSLFHLLNWDSAGNNLVLDLWFRLRGQLDPTSELVLVTLDQRFSDEYPVRIGELDRRFYTQAISHLAEAGAKVIAMDIFFPEPSGSDSDLAQALLDNGVILPFIRLAGAASFKLSDHVPFNPLLEGARRGVLELETSARQFQPVVAFKDGELNSFALEIVEAAGLSSRYKQKKPILIDYRGPAGSFPSLSFLTVYRNEFAYSEIQNKIVLIGVTLEGTDQDQIITPFGKMSGLEVNANQIFTLIHGKLHKVNPFLYVLGLLFLALLSPYLANKKHGLLYSLLGVGLSLLASYLAFRLNLFFSPLSPMLVFAGAYISGSYGQLRKLDLELNTKLLQILDSATFSRPEFPSADSLHQGFAPKGYVTDATDMLESLEQGLGAKGGLLIFRQERAQHGDLSPRMLELAEQAMTESRPFAEGTLPHYLAQPIELNGKTIGVLALNLPAPPPPHFQALLTTSLGTFSQLARYQNLRSQTTTLTHTLLPRVGQSSQAKLEALSMLSDLLAAERGWLGTLLETLPQAVFIMSPYGYSIYKNASARRLLGNEKNMLRGIPEALNISQEQFQEAYVTMIERGETLELGLTERKASSPILLSLKVVRDGSEIRGVAGTISDLSKISELDQQRQDMIAMVVHDLRSPLTSIQGFADLLLSGEFADPKEPLEIIRTEAARMRRLTDAFLDLSRLESEGFKPAKQKANVADLLRRAVAAVSAQASQKQMIIQLDAPDFLEASVDADLISRVMINLLSNGVKYSRSGKHVYAQLEAQTKSFRLVIKDEGHGMSQEQLNQLFQKYKRGTQTQVVGTGLGLYLVKLIVDAHQGTLKVSSEIHQGSCFSLEIPLD